MNQDVIYIKNKIIQFCIDIIINRNNLIYNQHCQCDLSWEDALKGQIRYEVREFQCFKKLKECFSEPMKDEYYIKRQYNIATIFLGLCRQPQVRMFFRISLKPIVQTLYTANETGSSNDKHFLLYRNSLHELKYSII